MRKYYQLILFILSVVSLVCFVIYKHEYDRLRNVLEVLNVFGSTVTDGPQTYEFQGICSNGSVEFIPDFWHKYSEVQVYAAFKVANEKGWSLNSVAVVKRNSSFSMKNTVCALISGDVNDDKFEGTIEWKQIETDNDYVAYSVVCNVPEMIGNSHLFSLYDSKSSLQPLNVPLHLGPTHPKDHATSLCVLSNDPYWHTDDLADFIHYYSLLGVDNIYLYHRGIGDQVISSLQALARTRTLSNVTIHLTTWNRPSSSSLLVDFALINHDCSWRHGAKQGSSITVQFGHFLALPKGLRLKEFLAKARGHSSESSFEVRIPLQTICANLSATETSLVRRARMINPKKKVIRTGIIRWTEAPNHPGNPETVKVDSQAVKLLIFEQCRTTENGKTEDETVRTFRALAQNIPRLKN